jgi:hypothetical protein
MPTKLASLLRSRKAAALLLGPLTVVALGAGAGTASASEGSRVEILNANSDLCMSIPGDVIYTGQRIDQWDCGGYADQYWYLNPSASHPGWFYIQPQQNDTLCATYVPGTNDVLTLQGCGTNAGSGNASTQLWRYIGDNELETFQGWAMSVPGASTTHDVSINIYPYGPYPDQHWGIYSA